MYYRHFKGRYYQVVGEALDTTTDDKVIVYRTLYSSDHALFTRPYHEFHGVTTTAQGETVQRFTPVERADLPQEAKDMVVQSIPVMDSNRTPSNSNRF